MTVTYTITSELREKFKEPFGTLIQGSVNQTMTGLKDLVARQKPPIIVSVGDVVSKNLHDFNIHPQLTIIDNKSQRNRAICEDQMAEKAVHVINPQGTITQEAICAIKLALEQSEHTHIIVDGEEDLLTLAAVLYGPEKSFVVYGQPNKGIVVVKVTLKKKAEVKEYLKAMEPFGKAK